VAAAVGGGRYRNHSSGGRRSSGAHQGVQIGSLEVVPGRLAGRKGLSLIQGCKRIPGSIVDNSSSFELKGRFGGKGRGQRRTGEVRLQGIRGGLTMGIIQPIVQQTIVSGWRWKGNSMTQQRVSSGQFQPHYTIVKLVGIQILQEEAMELRGYGIDNARFRFCGSNIGHKLQLIAIKGQHGLLIGSGIPRGDRCFTHRTEDQTGYGTIRIIATISQHLFLLVFTGETILQVLPLKNSGNILIV